MDPYKIKLAGIILILFFAGCREPEKDDLTLPARIQLFIGIAKVQNDDWDKLMYWGGEIGIQRIRFEGKREAGEGVFFETDPRINFQQLRLTNPPISVSNFDIPRGVYTDMKWEIDLKKIVSLESLGYKDFDSLNIGLSLSGSYDWMYGMYWDEPLNSVILAVDDTVKLTFRSHENVQFELSEGYEDRTYAIFLLFDPYAAFNPIPQDSIQSLETSKGDWGEEILISSNRNENLYKNLLYKIIQSVRVN
jgi:hypothetical protein